MDPLCAAAFGARTLTSVPASSAANIMDFESLFMLFSPFAEANPARPGWRDMPYYPKSWPFSKC
jgi:hypothetical protein